jgi:hypothetical protein
MNRSRVVAASLVAATMFAGCNRALPTAPPETATPTPAPTPAPTPTPRPIGCGLSRGSGEGTGCPRESPTFQAAIEAAIDKAIAEHPEYFDFRAARGTNNYRTADPTGYVKAVVHNLRLAGLCAYDDGEEVAVKNTNAFNDQFDILTADGFVRRSYRTTCYPAWHVIPPHGDNS